jgi:glutamate N-acetyltransferase/amino-acid N-acetyltransferase
MTGPQGLRDSLAMAAATAAALGIPEKDMCVASTGLIGKPLALSKIMDAIPALVAGLSTKGSTEAAKGILTTDRIAKEVAVEIVIGGRKIRIGAIAKGSGMIHPDMKTAGVKHATMLCFATTDAVIEPVALRAATSAAIENTFNMITVDGDTSTNDMVVTLANGMAGNRMIRARSKESHAFAEALESVFSVLAKLIVRDGEGATKFVTVSVAGAHTLSDARILARTVASSNLTKCAFFGSDPNWGRIAAAAGRSGARVDQSRMRIYIGRTLVVKKGVPTGADHKVLRRAFMKKEIAVRVDLGLGSHGATAYTCDFSYDYVRINSAYRT